MLFRAASSITDRSITIKGQTVTVPGKLKKISINGVAVECTKKAGIGTRLELVFELPALGRFNQMSIYGHVKGLHNTAEGYYMSIQFEDTPRQQTEIIKDFIDYKNRLLKLGQKYKSHLQV